MITICQSCQLPVSGEHHLQPGDVGQCLLLRGHRDEEEAAAASAGRSETLPCRGRQSEEADQGYQGVPGKGASGDLTSGQGVERSREALRYSAVHPVDPRRGQPEKHGRDQPVCLLPQ